MATDFASSSSLETASSAVYTKQPNGRRMNAKTCITSRKCSFAVPVSCLMVNLIGFIDVLLGAEAVAAISALMGYGWLAIGTGGVLPPSSLLRLQNGERLRQRRPITSDTRRPNGLIRNLEVLAGYVPWSCGVSAGCGGGRAS